MLRMAAACFVILFAVAANAEDLSVGDKAPDFTVTDVDGKQYTLSKMDDAKAVVVCFTCNNCPVAVMYEDRFVDFAKEYAGKGVKFIAVNANYREFNSSDEAMKQRAEEKGFTFPYTKDESGVAAKSFGAKTTPHLFVLDGSHKLVYKGAFDDNTNGDKATKPYVKDAVDAVLSGKSPAVNTTKPVGCGIQYKR